MSVWASTLLAVLIISLVSLIGVASLTLGEAKIKPVLPVMIAFAVGAIFGDAFLHILPEISEAPLDPAYLSSLLVLAGIMLFFVLEKFVHWRHCHVLPCAEHVHPVGMMNLIGDGVHNFLDGAIIAGSFLASPSLGLATSAAVLLHEIPQEIGDFATLLHAGYSSKKALLFNFLSALTAFAGAIVVLVWGAESELANQILLPLTAGGFIYIAGSDLIPTLHKNLTLRMTLWQFGAMLAGIGAMFSMLFLE